MTTASMSTAAMQRFVGWEIRPLERVLTVRGQPVKVGGRAFDLLLALVLRSGRVVDKAELLDAVWPGLVVEENNLSVQITALRKVLGAAAIVNVAGRGYRLAATPLAAVATDAPVPQRAGHPAAAGLVGRDADLAALLPYLGEVPLLSLVGTGGVGKTALARALLAHAQRARRDGVHWIDLAPCRRGEALLPIVARALGIEFDAGGAWQGEMALALAPLDALIVLDNCEHLLDAVVAFLAPLLAVAPGVRWLATSQEPLRLAGEMIYRLGPLAVAEPGAAQGDLMACGAIALFLQRVRATDRDGLVDGPALLLAAEICRALDGLPLALEMAAARVATLGLRTVHAQLHQRLGLRSSTRDVPERQSTLRHTYEWSYALLSPLEQRFFCLLQPFLGGCTAALASDAWLVAGGGAVSEDASALDVLSALVDKSLVQRMPPVVEGGEQRFMLLESAREFAALKLADPRELDRACRAHAESVARWFQPAVEHLSHWRDRDWAARYLPERRNVAAALEWSCDHGDPALLAGLISACAQLDTHAHLASVAVQLRIPLERLRVAPLPLRACAGAELGWAHFLDGSREVGAGLLQQALADYEALGDRVGVYTSLTRLIRLSQGRPGMQAEAEALWARLTRMGTEGIPLRWRLNCESTVAPLFDGSRRIERLQQLLRVAQQAGFETQATICQLNITDELLRQRRYEEAAQTAGLLVAQGPRWLRSYAMICHNQAHALLRLDRVAEARTAILQMLRALPSAAHMAMDLWALAAVRQARLDDAAVLAGCSARIKRERDWCADPAEAELIDETLAALHAALPPTELARLLELGAAMSVAEVLALAELVPT